MHSLIWFFFSTIFLTWNKAFQSNPIKSTSRKLGSRDFWRVANSVLNKGKSAIPPLFIGPKVLSPASDKTKLFAKNFSKNSYFAGSGISLSAFFSRTNLKLYNISATPWMVKKVIKNLDSSKASGPDCIPELWAGTFIYTSWTLQYVSEGVLFSKLLEGLMNGPCI